MMRAQPTVLTRLLFTISVSYLVMLAVSLPQLLDPLVRHDDFPALLADPSGYYNKTLYEGRWLNYLWHLREWTTPAWLNFAVYQLFWVTFAAATAINACARAENLRYVIGLALMIAVAAPAYLISLWFNTLLPGLGLVALYAVLSVFLSTRLMRGLLFVFVPLTLTAYTTYPLLLLAVVVTACDTRRSFKDLFAVVALFTASFAFGMLVIYTLNYMEHGIFGIPMAEWRKATPAVDLASLLENLQAAAAYWAKTASSVAFHFRPMMIAHLVFFVAGLVILARKDLWQSLYIVAGFLVGFGLLTLQVVMTGVELPVRANGFVWVLYSVVLMRMVFWVRARGGPSARVTTLMFMIIVASYLQQTTRHYMLGWEWQRETRAIALALNETTGPIYVMGDYEAIPGAKTAGIQESRGLRLRLVYLTGRAVVICTDTPAKCGQQIPSQAGDEPAIVQIEGATVLRLPAAAPGLNGS